MLPLYRVGKKLWIEAHLMGLVNPINRIWLVMPFQEDCLVDEPREAVLPYDEVKRLFAEVKLDELIRNEKNETRLTSLEHMYIPLYNPGRYMARIGGQLSAVTRLTIMKKIQEEVLRMMPSHVPPLKWVQLSIVGNDVITCGSKNPNLTYIFNNDDKARMEIKKLIFKR
ncbi:hypothetical protein GCM10007981_03780 [Thermocladium modestius]|uniref:Uncharacterized protein n=1 Tax=Thermocladium modestius TaxID=62609 RepID=A0A830GU57_9CREN|nr:hypothetical protein [Thermocladium modestius]GGP19569.1 hypothetical protein GCM10007981_03780 [Thermocladium modestius]